MTSIKWDPAQSTLTEDQNTLRCRHGSQTFTLIDSLSLGPIKIQKLARRVFDLKAISEADYKKIEQELRILISRVNKKFRAKKMPKNHSQALITVANGSVAFSQPVERI